ncbi:hypothetical protein Taro_053942 [Colocasia esculenta]|uniref:Protein translation factor SUI1 homolog n=1 Tax=Colocasia esculenta TaxID=4460 RepID=A0A843XP13_COLES|nr:hypothetical protein [Colocasia esculenta]
MVVWWRKPRAAADNSARWNSLICGVMELQTWQDNIVFFPGILVMLLKITQCPDLWRSSVPKDGRVGSAPADPDPESGQTRPESGGVGLSRPDLSIAKKASGAESIVLLSVTFEQPRFMSELDDQTPSAFDPFAEANADDSGAGSKEYVHVRTQQRNGRKSLTTVQGLKKEFSYTKILKDLKKEFCCNGTVVQDPELGQVIQLQGDQRKNVSTFLIQAGIVKKEHIKIHGF